MPERKACKYLVCRLFNVPADGWPTPKTKTGPVCSCLHDYITTPRNRIPANGNHLDQSLSSSQQNRNSLAWVLAALQCILPTLYCIESRPNLELASGNCES